MLSFYKGGNEKFFSFLLNTMWVEGHIGKDKFPYLLRNEKLENLRNKESNLNLNFDYSKLRWTYNEEVCYVLYAFFIYLFFYLLFYHDIEMLEELFDENRVSLSFFLFNFSILYYFFNNILYKLYNYNINIRYIVYAYSLDAYYKINYMLLFSYYIYLYL